jgi:hypothetical protein
MTWWQPWTWPWWLLAISNIIMVTTTVTVWCACAVGSRADQERNGDPRG